MLVYVANALRHALIAVGPLITRQALDVGQRQLRSGNGVLPWKVQLPEQIIRASSHALKFYCLKFHRVFRLAVIRCLEYVMMHAQVFLSHDHMIGPYIRLCLGSGILNCHRFPGTAIQ